MIDIDYAPGVFAFWILCVLVFPALYGIFFVDANWRKHQQDSADDDAFN